MEKRQLLTLDGAISYAKEKGLFEKDALVMAEEIGDGNINYVFRLRNRQRSVVLKQADVLLRSSGRPLDIGRSRIEAAILREQGALLPEMVPEVFFYDEERAIIAMEDISEYKNLRKELKESEHFPNFVEEITDFLAMTLFYTSFLYLTPMEKKKRVQQYMNPELCDISECLVFTEPYNDNKGRNIITPGNEDYVRRNLYENPFLHQVVAEYKEKFMNSSEALIHGDLHSGSIFVTKEHLKVIDPEFAFYGPMAYDVGNVLAHLEFPRLRRKYFIGTDQGLAFLEKASSELVDKFIAKFRALWQQEGTDALLSETRYMENFLERLREDSYAYAGLEIIRRVVGDSKVAELTSIETGDTKLAYERDLIHLGIDYILNKGEKTWED